MTSSSVNTKIKLAGAFLLDAPPGEFNDVLSGSHPVFPSFISIYIDIRTLIADDVALQEEIKDVLKQHNEEQFMTADSGDHKVRECGFQVIVTKIGCDEDGNYLDPASNQTFQFDHLKQVVISSKPLSSPPASSASIRDGLDSALSTYVKEHFPEGIHAVYGHVNGSHTIVIVSNKYNPSNFWNGRWRSLWTLQRGTLTGWSKVKVHYYEDGNVQLASTKQYSMSVPEDIAPAAVAQLINKAESEFQQLLNESYVQLSESSFKTLRRALPITRTKLDWNKILNYKVAAELSH